MTGLIGIALALQQRDVKRVLAYSSIENMGLIGLALGVGLWGLAINMPVVAVLGMTAGLLHIWNHTLMKGLMFFAAGSVLHGTGTKDMEKLGGLMKRMPLTGSTMLVGAVAITALPPLNGFVSKWLMYLSLMKVGLASEGGSLAALLAVGLLALIGGLAAVAFVRLTGVVLLGSPRTEAAQHAHESSPWLLGPMLFLLVLCFGVAVSPVTVTGWLTRPLMQLLGPKAGQTLRALEASEAPLNIVGTINVWLLIGIAVLSLTLLALLRREMLAAASTWGCGFVRPTARMQYTARSFGEMIAKHLLPQFLRPHTTRQEPRGLFPATSDFGAVCLDPVSEKVYKPFFRRCAEQFSQLRILQQGKVSVYLLYIGLMVVLALAWVSLRTLWATL